VGATQGLSTNIVIIIANFLYKRIVTRFGCPLTIVTNQGIDFINDVIRYFIDHFIFKHTSSIVYYSQGNGQVESMIGTSICPHYYSHIEQHTRLELVTHLFNLFMDYIQYYLQSTY
jgi:hypothetical protein